MGARQKKMPFWGQYNFFHVTSRIVFLVPTALKPLYSIDESEEGEVELCEMPNGLLDEISRCCICHYVCF